MAKPIDKLDKLACPFCGISYNDKGLYYFCNLVGEENTSSEQPCSIDDMNKCKITSAHSNLVSAIVIMDKDFGNRLTSDEDS